MINTVFADGKADEALIAQLKERSGEVDKKVTLAVTDILENVKMNGDKAVLEYTIKFDGKAPEKAEITKEEIDNLEIQQMILAEEAWIKNDEMRGLAKTIIQ